MSKKTFKNEFNPALQFISEPKEESQEPQTQKSIDNTVPMKRNPLYIETKSKRVQLLFQPSLYNKLKEISAQNKTSLNDLIHTVLEQYSYLTKD